MNKTIYKYSTISLKEMKGVALLKRVDTKFIIHMVDLISILKEIKNNYKVLEIDKNRIMTYKNQYFDTETKNFYQDHHNGRNNRIKIRIRKYIESKTCFLEIKQKNGKGETDKSRIKIPDFEINLSERSMDFIRKKTNKNYDLSTTIKNQFNRITLVNTKNKERITIDLNLIITKNRNKRSFENLVIIELKQDGFNRDSIIVNVLKKHNIHPYRISKYCLGMASMYENLKKNEFKRKFLRIEKLGE